MRKVLFCAAFLSILLTGCNKQSSNLTDIPIKLSVSLEGETRATHLTTDRIQELDFIIRDQSNSSYSYSNTRFTRNGNLWEPETKMLWSSHFASVDILAVSPCLTDRNVSITNDNSAPLFSWEIEKVQTAESYASDLLMSIQSNSNPNITISSGVLGVCFKHAMSLLTIKIEMGNEFNSPSIPERCPIQSLSIGGLKLKGDYYSVIKGGIIWDGLTLVPQTGTEGEIQAYPLSWTPAASTKEHCSAVYECIILPQNGNGMTITAKTENIQFTFTPALESSFNFEGGKSYILNLKVGKDSASISSVTVKNWQDGAYLSEKVTD